MRGLIGRSSLAHSFLVRPRPPARRADSGGVAYAYNDAVLTFSNATLSGHSAGSKCGAGRAATGAGRGGARGHRVRRSLWNGRTRAGAGEGAGGRTLPDTTHRITTGASALGGGAFSAASAAAASATSACRDEKRPD